MKTNYNPYVKKYDSDGILLNPITKENPYLFGKESLKGNIGFRMWRTVRNRFFTGITIVKM